MFVTEEERLSLGGKVGWLLGFLLPMMVFGVGASLLFGYAFGLGLGAEKFALNPIAIIAGSFACFMALIVWHGKAPIWSLGISLVSGSFLVGLLHVSVENDLPLIFQYLAVWIIAAIGRVMISNAIDTESNKLRIAWPSFFIHLVTIPVQATLLVALLGVFAIIGGVIWDSVDLPELASTKIMLIAAGIYAGIMVSIIRTQRVLIGAVRYGILLAGRFGLPYVVVISLAALAASWQGGSTFVMTQLGPYTPLILASLLSAAMILVYNTGENPPPAFWVRLSFWVSVPLLMGVIAVMVTAQGPEPEFVDAIYQDTIPTKDAHLVWAIPALFGLVAAAGAIGMVTEFRKRAERWMPPFGPVLLWGSLLWLGGVIVAGIV